MVLRTGERRFYPQRVGSTVDRGVVHDQQALGDRLSGFDRPMRMPGVALGVAPDLEEVRPSMFGSVISSTTKATRGLAWIVQYLALHPMPHKVWASPSAVSRKRLTNCPRTARRLEGTGSACRRHGARISTTRSRSSNICATGSADASAADASPSNSAGS